MWFPSLWEVAIFIQGGSFYRITFLKMFSQILQGYAWSVSKVLPSPAMNTQSSPGEHSEVKEIFYVDLGGGCMNVQICKTH